MIWAIFCSQTGGEAKKLSDTIDIIPDFLITNNVDRLSKEVRNWIEMNKIDLILMPNNPSESDYDLLSRTIPRDAIVTLLGYLRIIPAIFLQKFKRVFNGHPGLITKYPELKGFNPQKKAFNLKMREVGSVVHKVIEEVDCGEIVCQHSIIIGENLDLNEYFTILRECSLTAWTYFFKNKLYLS
jgi:folate-dependent phosphoribosylglycinamide formyltransferase PurN